MNLTIVIPFSQDRENQLKELLPQLPEHTKVIVVEQLNKEIGFNRGLMKNIGFLYSHTDYVCFHDVDYIDINVDYTEVETPTSLANYHLSNYNFFGGVVLMKSEHFNKCNGYSNLYFQWGLEDDDLLRRLRNEGLDKQNRFGEFNILNHDRDNYDAEVNIGSLYFRYNIRNQNLYKYDGLNTIFYTGFDVDYKEDFTHLKIVV